MKLPPVIILAAGHGGNDCGAVSPDGRHNERDQAIRIVDDAAAMLNQWGIRTVVAPHRDDTHETIRWLNRYFPAGSAWALEIHRDSAATIKDPDASMRCGVYHGSSQRSKALALRLVTEMRARGATATSWARDQKESRFSRLGWIAQPSCLSHLVELGFMQGRNDSAHLTVLANLFANALTGVVRMPGI